MMIPKAFKGQPMSSKSSEIAIIGVHEVPGAIMMINAQSEASCVNDRLIPYMLAAVSVIAVSERQKPLLFSDAPTGIANEDSLDEIPISLQALRLSGIAALVEHVVKAVIIVRLTS